MARVAGLARSALSRPKPSRRGIITSDKTRSGGWLRTAASAASPSGTASTSYAPPRRCWTYSRVSSPSSAQRMRGLEERACASRPATGPLSIRCSPCGILTSNRLGPDSFVQLDRAENDFSPACGKWSGTRASRRATPFGRGSRLMIEPGGGPRKNPGSWPLFRELRTSSTLALREAGLKGFWRKANSASRILWRTTASSARVTSRLQ